MKKVILYIFILLLPTNFKLFSQQDESIDTILDKSMKAAEVYSEIVEEYDAEIYMRMYIKTLKRNFFYRYTHLIPNFVLHNRKGKDGLFEVISDLRYRHPNNYTADIKQLSGTFRQKDLEEMLPSNLVHLNVYNEMSSNERFFMPLREEAKKYYRYELQRTFTENGTTYYTICFTPIYKAPKLLEGTVILEKDTWRVVQFVCEGVDLASEFSIELNMGTTKSTEMLPINSVIHQKFSYLGNVVTNRCLVNINYRLIQLNEKREKKQNLNISNFHKVRLDSVPIKNDPKYWKRERKIPLQAKEKEVIDDFLLEQEQNKQENLTKDTLNNKNNKAVAWAKTMVRNSNYKYKNTSISYSGMLNPFMLGYSSFDGLTYRQKVGVNFELKRQTSIEMRAFVGYMFKRKELFTNLSAAWNYNPTHLGKLSLSVGNGNKTYSSIYLKEVQDSLASSGLNLIDLDFEYYNDYYFKLNNKIEITNGFTIDTGIDFHIRKAANNQLNDLDDTKVKLNNDEEEVTKIYKKQKIFEPSVILTWTPEQYYRFERRQKIYVRSPYPTIKIAYSKGLRGVLGSTSGYNRVELDISQSIQLNLMKSLHYHIGMGFFSNQQSEYFTDFEFFAKRNFPETWDDGIGGVFNLLDRRFYNASDTYVQNHLMYESPFLILNLIPVISQGVITERLYLSHLYNPYIRSYTEAGYGIGNNFFNAAVFGSFHKLKFHEIGFKISLNIF